MRCTQPLTRTYIKYLSVSARGRHFSVFVRSCAPRLPRAPMDRFDALFLNIAQQHQGGVAEVRRARALGALRPGGRDAAGRA